MSPVSPILHAHTSIAPSLTVAPAPIGGPVPETVVRTRRAAAPDLPASAVPQWTLPPAPVTSADADRQLHTALISSALRQLPDSTVAIPHGATIYAGFDALRSAFNTAEMRAWITSKGLTLDTVVVKPDSISGWVVDNGVATQKTFTLSDTSGWWQVSARLRAAAAALDVTGNGLAYVHPESEGLSRNAVLHGYGVTPPNTADELGAVRQALSTADWSVLSAQVKGRLEQRTLIARKAIDVMDERVHLAGSLSERVRHLSDEDEVLLSGVQTPISRTSALAIDGADKAAVSEVLASHGLPVPKTAREVRNILRWLDAALPPAPALGDYAQLISRQWAPGVLSDADKRFVAELSDDDTPGNKPALNLLRVLDIRGVLALNTAGTLRADADRFLDEVLSSPVVLNWGRAVARNRHFQGASGSDQLSTLEAKQWVLAAIMLQIDPDAPGRPGTVAGYDIYHPANNGRTLASVRTDIETHLWKKTALDPKVAPLLAHLFLAAAAPEFLLRDVPSTLRMGSAEWADLRLGVTFAERQGGTGSSRAMSYQEVMALARLDPRSADEAAVLDNHGVDVLLDWGLMQGIYAKTADGRYTPQHYQQAREAFQAQREQLLQALMTFKAALPTRRDQATANLQKVFPELSGPQLQALKVHIADPDERRNMKVSEPKTRSLIETYMTGDLVRDRWMLLEADTPGVVGTATTPFPNARPSRAEQAAIVKNVRALNAKIKRLPNLPGQVASEVDTYLGNLKQGLGTTTKRMLANLPLADRQALEYGAVELFALREHVDGVPTLDQTSAQVEERRGRKGTLIRCDYNGLISYFEVFPAKMLIVKREDLPDQLTLGGTLQETQRTYGRWAPSTVRLQNGAMEPFDFTAYTCDALPRSGVSSPGIIIDRLGDTLPAAPASADGSVQAAVPNSFASPRSQAIVDRIMQGNFIHHRDSVLKYAQGQLPLEQQREVSQRNDSILLSMIPFVGAIVDLAKGNIIEGTRGLLIDTVGAFLGGAGASVRSLVKSTKAVAPFGAKAFRVVEKGVTVVSAFLNPIEGAADLLVNGAKGVLALPHVLSRVPNVSAFANMLVAQEKLRAFFGVRAALDRSAATPNGSLQAAAHQGHNHGVPVRAVQAGEHWYAVNPQNGLAVGTPLDGYRRLGEASIA
jgi:hypothetical protein